MARLPWIVGGGAIAAYLYARGAKRRVTPAPLPPITGRWVWPVPRWNGRAPVISDGFDSPRPGAPRHGGADLMFERQAGDSWQAGTPNGSRGFVMPDNVPALAASDGVVWSAQRLPTGYAVVIDHAPQQVATFYAHLETVLVAPKQRVRAGDPIGVIGASPLDGEHLKHLHFELWRGGPLDGVDPAPLLAAWEVVGDPRATLIARNASLVYRSVGAAGEPYPQWVRDLKDLAGVYVIREAGETVYVGSSRTQLYDTLTRHFQTWRRWKGFWRGQYGEGHDPGLTYERDAVEVAVRVTSPNKSLDEEMRLIRRLKPRDNLIGQADRIAEETVPF